MYFVRHGESEANRLHMISNRDLPHGLTETGRAQMEHLAERLKGIPFAAFYASPLPRARQSADIVGARLRLPYTVTAALAEFDLGILEGRSDAASWRRYDELLDAWLGRSEWHVRIEGGESFEDVRARFRPLIETLTARPPGGSVLLLGHGGTFMCMLPLVLSNVTVDFARERTLKYTELVVAELGSDGLTCLAWGETESLGSYSLNSLAVTSRSCRIAFEQE
jgi:broad specificity phosphatase PhoE